MEPLARPSAPTRQPPPPRQAAPARQLQPPRQARPARRAPVPKNVILRTGALSLIVVLLAAAPIAARAQGAQGFALSPLGPANPLSEQQATPESAAPVQDQAESTAPAQGEQDAQSKALDSTATQWSFQLSYQNMPDYHMDTLDDGSTRAAGSTDYIQVRAVIPVALGSFTILPRITLRHYENAQGQSGIGNTEIFALIIPRAFDWGTGRFGIGPLVTLPGNGNVSRDEWGGGFAAAAVNSSGSWFYGTLFTQSWRSINPTALPPGNTTTNPLGIAPIINYSFGKSGWYVGNGDQVALYDWDSGKFYLPIGVRFGKVLIREQGSWNIYGEYQTSLIYKSYPGPAVKNSYRVNVSYTIPIG